MVTRARPWPFIAGVGGIALTTFIYLRVLDVRNAAIVSTSFLLVVLLVAASSTLGAAVATSVVAMLCFNYFFLPPVRTFTIADPQNWVALFAFLVVSLVASNLSARARAKAREAHGRRDELARLYDLSRDVLLTEDTPEGLAAVARAVARRFDLGVVALAVPRDATHWDVVHAGAHDLRLPESALAEALEAARQRLEFDAEARTYAGHRPLQVGDRLLHLIPLRVGTKAIGLLAVERGRVDAGTLDAIAGLAAMAIERVQLLQERRAAALTRQSEALKTTLLASIGHDLRTPLTTIRVGIENLSAASLSAADRATQAALVLGEVQRLDRLFANLLEMARLDAGSVAVERRRTLPSEIIDAARAQVGRDLRQHRIDVQVDGERPAFVDPRLTATALARVLENAAQYAPPGSLITIEGRNGADGLEIAVRDEGPGIPPSSLPRIFDRFYRGTGGSRRPSGTGMGLWIARGLLAAQGGRIRAENMADRGARFELRVPEEAGDLAGTEGNRERA